MNRDEVKSRLRREQDILDRLENVKRLIQMETTLLTCNGTELYSRYQYTIKGQALGINDLLHDLRGEIQLQLLSIVALCYGDNPDIGEPVPMLEWKDDEDPCVRDVFRETWEKCFVWNA